MIRAEVRQRVLSGTDHDKLVLLRFTEEENRTLIRWENTTEFEYGGMMYDLTETNVKDDTVYYWCIRDQAETRLEHTLEELISHVLGQNPRKSDNKEKSVKVYKLLYCHCQRENRSALLQAEIEFPAYTECYSAVCLSPPVPPPRSG